MKRLLVLLVAIAAAVALAGAFIPSNAATVGHTSISRQSLDSDLSAIAGSADYSCFLTEERLLSTGKSLPFLGAGTTSAKGGIYDATFVDDWLSSMITDQVTARLVTSDGLRAGPAVLSTARGVLERRITDVLESYANAAQLPAPECGGKGTVVLSSLPSWFVTEQVRAEADQALLDARAAGSGLSAGEVAGYFATHRGYFARDCLDAVVVGTRSKAEAVEADLRSGASFASEAKSVSVTQESAAAGGSIGCGYIEGSFLGTAVGKIGVGKLTPPVAGQGFYWVVKLTKRSPVSLGTVRPTVVTAIVHKGQTRAGAELTAALRSSRFGVDPRYGTAEPHSLTLVLPAEGPPLSSEISTSANRPSLTAASS